MDYTVTAKVSEIMQALNTPKVKKKKKKIPSAFRVVEQHAHKSKADFWVWFPSFWKHGPVLTKQALGFKFLCYCLVQT